MYNKQLGRGYFIINRDTLNDLLLSQQVSGAKMRNEKRQRLYNTPTLQCSTCGFRNSLNVSLNYSPTIESE